MASEKTLAIVLRLVEFSETSVIACLFTRDFGKINGLAKGARRAKSAFENALDLLAVCRLVFIPKSADVLDLLTEAKLERRFRAAEVDLSHLYAGYYVAELLRELTHDHDPHPELFDVADATLQALATPVDWGPVVMRFELSALRLLGLAPEWKRCASCGGAAPEAERVAFVASAGGVLCGACRTQHARQVVNLSAAARGALIDASEAAARGEVLSLNEANRGEPRAVLNLYWAHVLGHRPRLHAFLGGLAS